MLMADGMNNYRAIRLAELLQDFRSLQVHISGLELPPWVTEEDYREGYNIIRQCLENAQALLNESPPQQGTAPNGDLEAEKAQLQSVILDASAKRFAAQKIVMMASAGMRWIQGRSALLGQNGKRGNNQNQLRALDEQLQREFQSITDRRVLNDLITADEQEGKWVSEDPPLTSILQWRQRYYA